MATKTHQFNMLLSVEVCTGEMKQMAYLEERGIQGESKARTTRPAGRPSRGLGLAEIGALLPDGEERQGSTHELARQV